MSDEEDDRSEEEESEEEEQEEREHVSEPTEAELALKKRRAAQEVDSKGLDETAKELLQANKEERHAMEEEINELRKRNERRKKEREAEEKRLAAERQAEEEKRKAAEEEKRRLKEEADERRKKERASKLAEFEKFRNPVNKPNFVITKRAESSEEGVVEDKGVPRKSKEQQEAEKKAILGQRITALGEVDNLDTSKLAEKAKELHKAIFRLESEKFDYEKRFKAQQVDMMELAERARQANKVGRGGLKRIQVSSDDVDDIQARFSGAPAKIEMYSKYERQKDKRAYRERKTCFAGPVFAPPVERIRATKGVKWNEEGLPEYTDIGEGGAAPPPAEVKEE